MALICLFDVDGTLTPTSQKILPEFEAFFSNFITTIPTYLVSGGEYKKLQWQLGNSILENCEGVFGCQGSEYFENGKEVYRKSHDFDARLKFLCQSFLDNSPYTTRTGNHIELRAGMMNISVVGRNADQEERDDFFLWDQQTNERAQFAHKINESHLNYEASIGGKISIDIVPAGWNKSIAAHEIVRRHPTAKSMFFGDRICEGGNDLPLANALRQQPNKHKIVSVKNHQDTWNQLKLFLEENKKDTA